jgi:hypothetical protein
MTIAVNLHKDVSYPDVHGVHAVGRDSRWFSVLAAGRLEEQRGCN